MSRNRFNEISSTLRFDDPQTWPARVNRDKLAAIRDLRTLWTHQLPLLLKPGRNLCVDEQMIPFRGRCSFRMFVKNKPAKYGIKIWALVDVKTYPLKLQVYTGKENKMREINQGMRVTLELTEGLCGYNVTTDNFFTSIRLADELLKRRMTLVGTIRRNKPKLPSILLKVEQRPLQSSLLSHMCLKRGRMCSC